MGKSSPTKLQLKHIPNGVVVQTLWCLQNMWHIKITSVLKEEDGGLYAMPQNRLSFTMKKIVHLDEIAEALHPIPKKLVWAKLKKLSAQGKISSYGPASVRFRVEN